MQAGHMARSSSQVPPEQEGFFLMPGHSPTPPGNRSKKCQSVQKSSPGLKPVSETRAMVPPSRLKTETPGIHPPLAET